MQGKPGDRDGTYGAVVSDLAALAEQVRRSLRLLESAMASEAAAEGAVSGSVTVLDDVTPGYARADAILRQCKAGLGVVLGLLQGSKPYRGSVVELPFNPAPRRPASV